MLSLGDVLTLTLVIIKFYNKIITTTKSVSQLTRGAGDHTDNTKCLKKVSVCFKRSACNNQQCAKSPYQY